MVRADMDVRRDRAAQPDALVSVIIPVYNVRPWLEEALDSVLRQTYAHLELLVIDDGSTDGSGEVCDRYAARDKRIRVIHQPNRGLSAARNAGLDAMTGEIVAFLDPDDAFHPEMIARLMGVMAEWDADIAACGSMGFAGALPPPEPLPDTAQSPRLMTGPEAFEATILGTGVGLAVWRRLYAARVFDGVRFPEGRVYEDMALFPALIYPCRRICAIDDRLVFHRRCPGSITRTDSPGNMRDNMRAKQDLKAFVEREFPGARGAAMLKKLRGNEEATRIVYWDRLAGCRDADALAFRRMLKRESLRHRGDLAPLDIKRRVNLALMVVFPPLCGPLYRGGRWLKQKLRAR